MLRYTFVVLWSALALVPASAVVSTSGYAELKPQPVVKSSFFKLLNPIGSDTGVVLRSRMVSATCRYSSA